MISLVKSRIGEKKDKAQKFYGKLLETLDSNYVPETTLVKIQAILKDEQIGEDEQSLYKKA